MSFCVVYQHLCVLSCLKSQIFRRRNHENHLAKRNRLEATQTTPHFTSAQTNGVVQMMMLLNLYLTMLMCYRLFWMNYKYYFVVSCLLNIQSVFNALRMHFCVCFAFLQKFHIFPYGCAAARCVSWVFRVLSSTKSLFLLKILIMIAHMSTVPAKCASRCRTVNGTARRVTENWKIHCSE